MANSPEHWTTKLEAALEAKQPQRVSRRSSAINYPASLFPLLVEAARRRGMSVTAYQRRAVLAFAVWDLGLDWMHELEDEGPIAPPEGQVISREPARGRGFGRWKITGLSSYE